jgi:hypothetical protein
MPSRPRLPAARRSEAVPGWSRPCRQDAALRVPSTVRAARGTRPSRTKRGRWHSRRHRTDRVRVRSSARGLCRQAQRLLTDDRVGFGGEVEHGRTRNTLHRESSHSGRDARMRVLILLLGGSCVKIRPRERLGPVRKTMHDGRAHRRPPTAHRVGAGCKAPRFQRERDFDPQTEAS